MKHPEENSGTSSFPIVSKIYTELFNLTDSIFCLKTPKPNVAHIIVFFIVF